MLLFSDDRMPVYNLQKLFVKCQFMKLLNFKKVE